MEQFFGRLYKLWGAMRSVYRLDHSHFDDDFDNCLLLTNENIRAAGLTAADRDFFLSHLEARARRIEAQQEKRAQQVRSYLERRKRPHSAIWE